MKWIRKVNDVEINSYWLLFILTAASYALYKYALAPNVELIRSSKLVAILILALLFFGSWCIAKLVSYVYQSKFEGSKK